MNRNCTIIPTTNRLKFEFKAHPNATCNIQYIYIFKKKKKEKLFTKPNSNYEISSRNDSFDRSTSICFQAERKGARPLRGTGICT